MGSSTSSNRYDTPKTTINETKEYIVAYYDLTSHEDDFASKLKLWTETDTWTTYDANQSVINIKS